VAAQGGCTTAWEAWGDEVWGDGAAVAGAVCPSPDTSRNNLKNSKETCVKTHQTSAYL